MTEDMKRKMMELRRNFYEIKTVVIDGKTYTVINATPIKSAETAADKLRYLVKES